MPKSLSPIEFLENVVYPAVFEHLDTVFPEFRFKRSKGSVWTATNGEETRRLPGEPRADRVMCYAPKGGFVVHGGSPVSWLSYEDSKGAAGAPKGSAFLAAVRAIAERAGVDVTPIERELSAEEKAALEFRSRRDSLLEAFVSTTIKALASDEGKAARAYLESRGLPVNPEVLQEKGWGLGYYPGSKAVQDALRLQGYSRDEVFDAGLANPSWAQHVVMPWRDENGRIVNLVAREARDGGKYLYPASNDSKGYWKDTKELAFGLDVALKGGNRDLIVVEGQFDVLLARTHGLDSIVAIGGSGNELSAARWQRLEKLGIQRVTLALDNDKAGLEGTEKALDAYLVADLTLRVSVLAGEALGSCKDPGDFIKAKGLPAFNSVLQQATPWEQAKAKKLLVGIDPTSPPAAKDHALMQVLDFTTRIGHKLRNTSYEYIVRFTAESVGVRVEDLRKDGEIARKYALHEKNAKGLNVALREAQRDLDKGLKPAIIATKIGEQASAILASVKPAEVVKFSVDAALKSLASAPAGLTTGWRALDDANVLLRPKELTLIAGRTGHGKSTALVNLFTYGLFREASGVSLLFSHEEPSDLVLCRVLSLLTLSFAQSDRSRCACTFQDVRSNLMQGNEIGLCKLAALSDAIEFMRARENRAQIIWKPSWSSTDICSYAHSRGDVQDIYVDYLQRVPAPKGSNADRRDIEVSAVARDLKTLAVELAVPVVVAAQINREAIPQGYVEKIRQRAGEGNVALVEYMRGARPALHHLREGGAEQEADVVLGVMNYGADIPKDVFPTGQSAEVHEFDIGILKNRYGIPGQWFELKHNGPYGHIQEKPSY